MIQRLASVLKTAHPTIIRGPWRTEHAYYCRRFSVSSYARADDSSRRFQEALRKSPALTKLASSPEAAEAVVELVKTFKNEGVDLKPGEKPSMLAMFKLMKNTKVREQFENTAKILQAAGVDFTSKEVIEELMELQKVFQMPAGHDTLEEPEKSKPWWRFK